MRLVTQSCAAALFAILPAACASSSAVQDAREGRYPALSAELTAKVRANQISNAFAADVARAVASREVLHADKESAEARVREVFACAFAIDDALAERMKTPDLAGALAAETRLQDHELSEWSARQYAEAPDGAWRAVGMRAMTRGGDRATRLRAIADPVPAVRRAAIHATVEAGETDGKDLDALFEAARLDPDLLARTDAVRAIARLAVPHVDVVGRLRDLWPLADGPLREDIAMAWASRAVLDDGGRHELLMLFAQEKGHPVLSGAGAVLGGLRDDDAELRAAATAILARGIASGSRGERLHAIAVSKLAIAPLLEAIREASKDDDAAVRTGALARLTESKADREGALGKLEALAQSDVPTERSRALSALAFAGDGRVQALLLKDLDDADADVRLSAARALGALGVAGRAAKLLADPDASVRTRAACSVLSSVRDGGRRGR